MKVIAIICLLMIITGMVEAKDIPKYKAGGICFRMDDNQNPKKWRDVAKVFNRHKQKLSASLNVRIMSRDNLATVKWLQSYGHEVMDHTPMHNISKFKFAPGKGVKDYEKHPGVDHISGNTVYLSYILPTAEDCTVKLKVSLQKDNLILTGKPDDKLAKKIRSAKVLYIPVEKRVLQLFRTKNKNEFMLRSIWGEKNVNEKKREVQACFLNDRSFSMSMDAIELLGRNSLDLFSSMGAKRPYSWIQPGGGISCISSKLAKDVLGKRLGYVSAATYVGQSQKVFREYNPDGSCAYGMMWGDFDEEKHDLKWNKTRIANLVALHHIAIGHSHMHPKDGWDNYLKRLDQLLAWCVEKKIPIRTQAEWAKILYSQAGNDKNDNYDVFPSLSVDLDENNRPDGYKLKRSSWDQQKNIIICRKRGELFAVENLAGLHKGNNRLTFSVSSDKDCQIKVSVRFPTTSHHSVSKIFTIKKRKNEQCKWDFIIPENGSTANFSWRLMKDGACSISKISLRKY